MQFYVLKGDFRHSMMCVNHHTMTTILDLHLHGVIVYCTVKINTHSESLMCSESALLLHFGTNLSSENQIVSAEKLNPLLRATLVTWRSSSQKGSVSLPLDWTCQSSLSQNCTWLGSEFIPIHAHQQDTITTHTQIVILRYEAQDNIARSDIISHALM